MTEEEWMKGTQPKRMLDHHFEAQMGHVWFDRKTLLFACASCRRVWNLMVESSRQAVETLELFADGQVSVRVMKQARTKAREACKAGDAPDACAARLAYAAVHCSPLAVNHQLLPGGKKSDRKKQAVLLQEIIGNPFRPVKVAAAWLTPTVKQIAGVIYQEKVFENLPILADAMEEAGCNVFN